MKKRTAKQKGGNSIKGDNDDTINSTITQVCKKLEQSGEDGLFIRVHKDGLITSHIGTKKANLFLENRPNLAEDLRKFCANVYSSSGTYNTRKRKWRQDKDGGEDTATPLFAGNEALDPKGPKQTPGVHLNNSTGHSNGSKDKKVEDTGTERREDKTCGSENDTESESRLVDGLSKRPRRKTATPARLELYETNFRKSSGQIALQEKTPPIIQSYELSKGRGAKPLESTCSENVEKNISFDTTEETRDSNGKENQQEELLDGSVESIESSDEEYDGNHSSNYEDSDEEWGGEGKFQKPKENVYSENDTSYQCKICDKKFKLKRSINRHIKNNVCKAVLAKKKKMQDLQNRKNNSTSDGGKSSHDTPGSEESSTEAKQAKRISKDFGDYKCEICGSNFKLRSSLTRHIANMVCSKVLARRKTKLLAENQEKERIDKDIDKIPGTLPSLSLKHLRHRPGNFKCGKCGASFKLRRSIKRHTDNNVCANIMARKKHFKCKRCGALFVFRRTLVTHILNKACKGVNNGSSGENVEDLIDSYKKTVTELDELKNASDNPDAEVESSERGDQDTQSMNTYLDFNEVKKCEFCGSVVLSKSIRRHIHSKLCKRIRALKEKGESGVDVQSLGFIGEAAATTTGKSDDKHMMIDDDSQTGNRIVKRAKKKGSYSCDICGFVMLSKTALRRHILKNRCTGPQVKLKLQSNVTPDQEQYNCEICNQPFISFFEFQRHSLRHQIASTQNKLEYTCPECHKSYLYDYERVLHMVRAHKLEGPVECQVCCHRMKSVADYRAHRKYCATTMKCQGEVTDVGKDKVNSENENTSMYNGRKIDQDQHDGITGSEEVDKSDRASDCQGDITPAGKHEILLKGSDLPTNKKILTSYLVSDENGESSEVEKSLPELKLESDSDLMCMKCNKDVRVLFNVTSGTNTCEICRKNFVNANELYKHKATHTAVEFYRCHKCGKSFTETRYLQRHLVVVHRERYSICRYCVGLFTSRPSLMEHIKARHLSQLSNVCRYCGETFPNSLECVEHEENRHQKKDYICDICGKILSSSTSLKMHINVHKDIRPHKCDHCQKRFRTKENLTSHLQIHSSVKAYQCEVCGQCFTLKETLRRHIRVHNKDKMFKCKYCNKKFRSTDGVNCHTLRNHLTAQDISKLSFTVRQCEICFKLFSSKQLYEQHMVSHTGNRPFRCDLCPREYGMRSLLLRHIRTVHEKTEQHTCLICNTTISLKQKWFRHLRTKKHLEQCKKLGVSTAPNGAGLKQGVHYSVGATEEEQVLDYGIEQIQNVIESVTVTEQDAKTSILVDGSGHQVDRPLEIVFQDQLESQEAVDSIVDGQGIQGIVYLNMTNVTI